MNPPAKKKEEVREVALESLVTDRELALERAINDPVHQHMADLNVPGFLRWIAHRLVHTEGLYDPRSAPIRAMHEVANRMEDALDGQD